MKKVGICTMYYDNLNYGANLQAYALQRIVSKMGFDAELVSYYNGTSLKLVLSRIKKAIKLLRIKPVKLRARIRAVQRFSRDLPHSKTYTTDTIRNANKAYDLFIVGSDQVWNPDWINQFYALDFVLDKPTIAFAVSIGKTKLSDEEKKKLEKALYNTDRVSIREEESIPMLKELSSKDIQHVLDPTMLLSKAEWDEICPEKLIKDKYMFCYFLESDSILRETAREYADLKGLKIATLPHLNPKNKDVDKGFGDYRLYDVSPKDFLSLIKHSAFVMTDSFHGAVLSHLFERPFIVSGGNHKGMGCRMQSLTRMFGTEGRYVKDNDMLSVGLLSSLEKPQLLIKWDNYYIVQEQSFSFLRGALLNDNTDLQIR